MYKYLQNIYKLCFKLTSYMLINTYLRIYIQDIYTLRALDHWTIRVDISWCGMLSLENIKEQQDQAKNSLYKLRWCLSFSSLFSSSPTKLPKKKNESRTLYTLLILTLPDLEKESLAMGHMNWVWNSEVSSYSPSWEEFNFLGLVDRFRR